MALQRIHVVEPGRHGCSRRCAVGAAPQPLRRDIAVPGLAGRLNIGGAAVFADVFKATGDLPPFLVYGVGLATGTALLRHSNRVPNLAGPTGFSAGFAF